MINPPFRSPREKVGGLYYFGRMIDKIRAHLRGELPEEYKRNFGHGLDGALSEFLNLNHSAIVERVRQGGTDEEILEWCALVMAYGPTRLRFASGMHLPRNSAGAMALRQLSHRLRR